MRESCTVIAVLWTRKAQDVGLWWSQWQYGQDKRY